MQNTTNSPAPAHLAAYSSSASSRAAVINERHSLAIPLKSNSHS